jgi:hypothetical protein
MVAGQSAIFGRARRQDAHKKEDDGYERFREPRKHCRLENMLGSVVVHRVLATNRRTLFVDAKGSVGDE